MPCRTSSYRAHFKATLKASQAYYKVVWFNVLPILKPLIRKDKASDKEMLWLGRIVVLVVAVVAFFIARQGLDNEKSWAADIMNMVENAWGLFGASFGPVVILSLFWKRFNYVGAVAGIIGGAVVDIAWLLLFTGTIREAIITNTGIYEIVPGFICGGIAAIIVTKISPEPGKEVTDIFDSAIAEGERE